MIEKCEKHDEMIRCANNMKLENAKKVSWKQLGVLVLIVVAVLGLVYSVVEFSDAGERAKTDTKCDQNAKQIQTFSVRQAVVVDKLETAISTQEKIIDSVQAIELKTRSIEERQIAETERSKRVDDVILKKLERLINK